MRQSSLPHGERNNSIWRVMHSGRPLPIKTQRERVPTGVGVAEIAVSPNDVTESADIVESSPPRVFDDTVSHTPQRWRFEPILNNSGPTSKSFSAPAICLQTCFLGGVSAVQCRSAKLDQAIRQSARRQ